jgi:hypothetical protein
MAGEDQEPGSDREFLRKASRIMEQADWLLKEGRKDLTEAQKLELKGRVFHEIRNINQLLKEYGFERE